VEAKLKRFKTVIEPRLRGLYRVAYRLAGNRLDAEDLVQETCLRAWEKLPSDTTPEHVPRWLLRVLYHRFVDGQRRKRRGPVESLNGADDPTPTAVSPTARPDELAERADRERVLACAWAELEPTQQVLLSLRAEGFGLEEIEAITGISRDVLRARLHRARQSFARHLEDADRSLQRPTRAGRRR
jgi:RNA polymerase sigma-70 factor, ECF subfamily